MGVSIPKLPEMGFGSKYTDWRKNQTFAIYQVLHSEKRFSVQVQPTGSGKSLCYMSMAKLMGKRTLILTSFKGLQDQLHRDFGVYTLMGRSAYKCKAGKGKTCEQGKCRAKEFCPYQIDRSCTYLTVIDKSRYEQVVSMNYSFWLANIHRRHELGRFDFLVCDEAHSIPQYVLSYMSITLKPKQLGDLIGWPEMGRDFAYYRGWYRDLRKEVGHRYESIKSLRFNYEKSDIIKLYNKLELVAEISSDNWVIEHKGGSISADMVWPTSTIQNRLFSTIDKILLTSATVDKHSCVQMGLTEENSTYIEFESDFPASRRPIYAVKSVYVDYKMSEMDTMLWMGLIDRIMEPRLGLKGIIHAVSYSRAKYIMEHSKFSEFMMTHTSKNTRAAIEEFKSNPDKLILVSPSVATGWDFPYDECRWQIMAKVPFPDLRSKVDKERKRMDPEYGALLACQSIVQACGRGMRFKDDSCETFIVDNYFRRFFERVYKYAPKSWSEAVRFIDTVPDPL